MKRAYIIEGLDRLGKSTLIEGIMTMGGFYQVIHYEKPKLLDTYMEQAIELGHEEESAIKRAALFAYQIASFEAMFMLLESGVPLILDRAHLGECVYAPMYRKYGGDYVFNQEERFRSVTNDTEIRLILLTEDFDKSKHFVEDGQSFDSTKRREEQELFKQAFDRSAFVDKKIICVTAPDGRFRNKTDILLEAIAE